MVRRIACCAFWSVAVNRPQVAMRRSMSNPAVVVSPIDSRHYDLIILDNGIEVMLVSTFRRDIRRGIELWIGRG